MDHGVVGVIDRPREFPADQTMREIGGQTQIGKTIEQLQGEQQVGRHAVAMRFDIHRDFCLFAEAPPPLKQGNAVGEAGGTDIRLQVDVVGAKLCHQFEHRLQVIDRSGIALRLPDHAVCPQKTGRLAREIRIDETHAGAVKPGIADHRELGLKRPLRLI
jgi:hypothetical protein